MYLEADEKYEIDVLKLKEKKWKDISAALADKLEVKKYTAPACKARWDALEDGSALLPIELDFDKEGRRVLREDRIAANKQRREDIKAAALWAAGEKDRRAAAKKALMDEKERERQAERARKQAEKDEDDRIKAEIRAGIEEKREKQRAIEAEIKQKLDAKREERKNADAMYVYLTGHKLNGRRDHELIKPKKEDDSDAEMEDWAGDIGAYYEDDEPEMPELNDDPESSVDESDQPKKSVKPGRRSTRTKVTIETLTNPRSVMNLDELDVLNKKRGLRRRDEREPHPEVIARIAVADAALGAKEVKDLLKQHFLNKKGSRDVMVRWLQEADAEGSALGKEGITATSPEFKAGYEGYRGKFAYLLEERSTEME